MDSLNVPVPGRVRRVAADLHPELVAFDFIRERHGLLCKRFERTPDKVALRDALAGTPAFEAAVTGIDYFTDPPHGSAPVVYLTVESPGLVRLHERLAERFDAVPGLEGEGYDPHVTLARGGDEADAARLAEREIDRVSWTVSRLERFDAEYREAIGTVSLPA
ncbi:MAG: 2'-5' RNA ligase family protein [Haloferacaceae archaeon]